MSAPAAPSVAPSHESSRTLVGLGIAVCVLAVGVLLWLQPDGGVAADGTPRFDPAANLELSSDDEIRTDRRNPGPLSARSAGSELQVVAGRVFEIDGLGSVDTALFDFSDDAPLDLDAFEVASIPFSSDVSSADGAEARLVGRVNAGDGPSEHLLVDVGYISTERRELWAVDVDTQDWSLLGTGRTGYVAFAVSASGNRVYKLSDSQLVTYDFQTGSTEYVVSSPLLKKDADFVGVERVLFANDEQVFAHLGQGRIGIVDAPPLPASARIEGAVVPVGVEVAGAAFYEGFFEIIPADVGLFGVASFAAEGRVPLYRSVDGLEWFPVDAIHDVVPSETRRRISWLGLRRTSSGLSVTRESYRAGADGDLGPRMVEVFTSADGIDWTLGESYEQPGRAFPVEVVESSSLWFEEQSNPRITQLVQEHTKVGTANGQWCDALGDRRSVRLVTCSDESVEVTADEIRSEVPSAEVLDCLATEGVVALANFGLIAIDRTSGAVQRTVENAGSIVAAPIELSTGEVAFIELGTLPQQAEFDRACDGLIEPETPRDSVLLFLDRELSGFRQVALPPNARRPEVRNETRLLGELSFDGGQGYLLAVFGESLWALDLRTDEWQNFDDVLSGSSADLYGQLVFLGDSAQLVSVDSQILVLEFARVADGGVSVTETLIPIDSRATGEIFSEGWIVYADEEVILFQDFDGGSLWRLELP